MFLEGALEVLLGDEALLEQDLPELFRLALSRHHCRATPFGPGSPIHRQGFRRAVAAARTPGPGRTGPRPWARRRSDPRGRRSRPKPGRARPRTRARPLRRLRRGRRPAIPGRDRRPRARPPRGGLGPWGRGEGLLVRSGCLREGGEAHVVLRPGREIPRWVGERGPVPRKVDHDALLPVVRLGTKEHPRPDARVRDVGARAGDVVTHTALVGREQPPGPSGQARGRASRPGR
jgi:hypothetical protein